MDFGMMSEISAGRRESLVDLFYAVYRSDADGVIAALMDLNIIVPTADPLSLRRAIAFGLANLTRKVQGDPIFCTFNIISPWGLGFRFYVVIP